METQTEIEETNPFSFADEIFGYADRLWKTLAYFVALSIFLVILVLWLAFGQPSQWDLLVFGYGFLVVVYFPVALWNSVRLVRPLKRWMDDYFDFAFVVKFELFPTKGATPTDRILNKLAEVYPEVSGLMKKRPRAIQRGRGLRKRARVEWDLVIDLDYPRVIRVPSIHRHLGTPTYLLVKRFVTESPVDVEALRQLGEGLTRDLFLQNHEIFRIFVISTTGFTPDAVAGIREESISKLSEYPVELVVETAHKYTLPIKD